MNTLDYIKKCEELVSPFKLPEIYYQHEQLILGIDNDKKIINEGKFPSIEQSILSVTEAIDIYKEFVEESYHMNTQWPEALFPICENNSQFLFIILYKEKSIVSPVYFLDVGAGDTILEYYSDNLLEIIENKNYVDSYLTDYDILKPETLPISWFK